MTVMVSGTNSAGSASAGRSSFVPARSSTFETMSCSVARNTPSSAPCCNSTSISSLLMLRCSSRPTRSIPTTVSVEIVST